MSYILQSVTTAAQPVSPSDGHSYYIPSGATGTDWAGNDDKIGDYTTTLGWRFSAVEPWRIYVVADEPSGGGNARMVYYGADSFAFVGNSIWAAQEYTWYVNASNGDAGHDGTSDIVPFASIADAITASEVSPPSSSEPHVIVVMDAKTYGDVEIPDWTHLYAPKATITGQVTLGTGASVECYRHNHGAAEAAVDRIAGGSEAAFYRTTLSVYSGSSQGLQNTLAGSLIHAKTNVMYATGGSSRYAVGHGAGNDGRIVLDVGEIVLGANSSRGVNCANSAGTISGRVGAIRDDGFTTTEAITVSDGQVDLAVDTIDADVAYNVSGGTLNLRCSSLSGTETFSGGALRLGVMAAGQAAVGDVLEHDGADYVPIPHHPTYQGYSGSSQTGITTGAGAVNLALDNDEEIDTDYFTHSTVTNNSEVTIDVDCYAVFSFGVQGATSAVACDPLALLQRDTGGGFATVGQRAGAIDTKTVIGDFTTLSLQRFGLAVSAGDKFRIQMGALAGIWATLAGGSYLHIEILRLT